MDARERGIGYALRLEPLDAAPVRLLRAERADIEAVARKRMGERGVAITFTSGKRSIEAKAVRGSTMVTS